MGDIQKQKFYKRLCLLSDKYENSKKLFSEFCKNLENIFNSLNKDRKYIRGKLLEAGNVFHIYFLDRNFLIKLVFQPDTLESSLVTYLKRLDENDPTKIIYDRGIKIQFDSFGNIHIKDSSTPLNLTATSEDVFQYLMEKFLTKISDPTAGTFAPMG